MTHPLCGANPSTLFQTVARAGAPGKPLAAAAIVGAVAARHPFSLGERLYLKDRLPSIEEMPAPVFILGHWRSGTTHLYNTMCKSGEWGFVPPVATGLPWDLFGIARAFRPLLDKALPEHRYIDNIPVTPESPQEDEIAIANMSPLSFYHAIYFPRAFSELLNRGLFFDGCSAAEIDAWRERFVYFLRKLYLHQGEKPLLIKNPVYTGRLAMLREMFPGAKYIHIHRNPFDVFISMRNFYRKLLAEFALQSYDHVDIDEAVLSTYDRMMAAFERDRAGLGEEQLIELPYGALDADALGFLREVYARLGLPGFDRAAASFEAYIGSVKSFRKNDFAYSSADARKVEARLERWLDKWRYRRPGLEAA